jgi:hypothetical protein
LDEIDEKEKVETQQKAEKKMKGKWNYIVKQLANIYSRLLKVTKEGTIFGALSTLRTPYDLPKLVKMILWSERFSRPLLQLCSEHEIHLKVAK